MVLLPSHFLNKLPIRKCITASYNAHGPVPSISDIVCVAVASYVKFSSQHFSHTLATSCPCSMRLGPLLAHQAVHRPGLLLAFPGAEAPVLAASPAAQRAQAPLVPAAQLGAPAAITPPRMQQRIDSALPDWETALEYATQRLSFKGPPHEWTVP